MDCKMQITEYIKFRIDTGARCNTLTLKDYQMIQHNQTSSNSRPHSKIQGMSKLNSIADSRP